MSTDVSSLSFTRQIQASPAQVYYAFTNSTALREWFSNVASTQVKLGGRVYFAWDSGYYAAGEFTVLQPEQALSFTWNGRNEPAASTVQVKLEAKDGGTLVTLVHAGLGSGQEWDQARQEIADGWTQGLENLASVLETGQDLRYVRRPMLGIIVSDFDAEIAAHLGVPVNVGLRIDGVVAGMGAEKAGLQSDDVLVRMAGVDLDDYANLGKALVGKRAGDVVEVVYYRGSEKKSVQMTLSQRPLPEIPATSVEIARELQKRYAEIGSELEQLFTGVTEEQASFKPGIQEWCAKEVLAHLLQGELYWHNYIEQVVSGYEAQTDGFGSNLHARVIATVAAYGSLSALLEGLKRAWAETVALFAALPPEFAERKGSYNRLGYNALDGAFHFHGHVDQMRSALEAARSSST